jgi:hypothetical protein
MGFERNREVKEILNIGRIKKAYRASYIRAVIEIFPVYFYQRGNASDMFRKPNMKEPAKISIGVIVTEDFTGDIQAGKTIPLRELIIKYAEEQAKQGIARNTYVIGDSPHYSFLNNEIFLCHNNGTIIPDEIPIEKIRGKDIVYRDKFYRFPEDV